MRPDPKWTVTLTSRERRRAGDEEDGRDVGKEVKVGESEEDGQECHSGGGADGSSVDEDDDEECKYVKGNAAVYSFLGKIVEGYSHRDPENHQSNISCFNEEIVLHLKLETEISNTRKDLNESR